MWAEFPMKVCLNELRDLSPALSLSAGKKELRSLADALAMTQELEAPISSALVLSTGIRMAKHLVWGPGCIHAPRLQVHARAERAICPGTGEKRHRFKSVPELRVNCSEQPLQGIQSSHILDTDHI